MMRIMIVILFSLLLINVKSQNALPEYKEIIRFYPLNLIGGHINAAYEKPLNSRASLEFNGSYYFLDYLSDYTEGPSLYDFPQLGNGFALRLSYRYFLKQTAPTGTYISPQLMYKYFYTDSLNRSYQRKWMEVNVIKNIYAFKFIVGQQSKITEHFLIDIYAGVGARHRNIVFDEFYYEGVDDDLNKWVVKEPRGKMRQRDEIFIIPTIHFGVALGLGFN